MAIVTLYREEGGNRLPYKVRVDGQKQVPFNKNVKPPLPYYLAHRILDTKSVLGSSGLQCGAVHWGEIEPSHVVTSSFASPTVTFTNEGMIAYARAYAKFKDMVYTQAANLTALKERAKTVDMVLARLKQLHRGASALRKGRFREFLDIFGVRALKKHEHTSWPRPKHFGALWLEYWMGWAPTVGDVYNSLDALSRRVPDKTVRAGSSVPLTKTQKTVSGATTAYSTYEGKGTVWIQGQVEVTNPSLHIVQTLGLLNPFKTVWETIGFSWLADWFTNVGQILGRITDWVGLRLKNLTISAKTEAVSSWECMDARYIYGWHNPALMNKRKSFLWFSRHLQTELPVVKPILRLPNGLSLTRGATLASLLATMFAPSKR